MEAEQTGFHPHYKFRHFPSILHQQNFNIRNPKLTWNKSKRPRFMYVHHTHHTKTKKSRLTIMQLAQCKTITVAK
jgi:hypothetical protein